MMQMTLGQTCFVYIHLHVKSLILRKLFLIYQCFLFCGKLHHFIAIPTGLMRSVQGNGSSLVNFSSRFCFSLLSLFLFRFVIHCSGALFFKDLNLRENFFPATHHLLQIPLFYCVCVDIFS